MKEDRRKSIKIMATSPDGPGWGVTIRRGWLEKAERQVTG